MPLHCFFHWPLRQTDFVFMMHWLLDTTSPCSILCEWINYSFHRKFSETKTSAAAHCQRKSTPRGPSTTQRWGRVAAFIIQRNAGTRIKLRVRAIWGDKERDAGSLHFFFLRRTSVCVTETPTFIITHFEREVHWTCLHTACFLLTKVKLQWRVLTPREDIMKWVIFVSKREVRRFERMEPLQKLNVLFQ